MAKRSSSLFKRISQKDIENIREAIKAKKYWKLDDTKIYTVILSRARIKVKDNFLVKTSSHGRVEVLPKPAKYCRRYRILIYDVQKNLGLSVVTWNVFTKIMKKYNSLILALSNSGLLPSYINMRTLIKFKKNVSNNQL
ncbi:MAG: hypothetical protein N3F64_04820 [Nitrososphaeria archaeon]|nr:hypothetical protein [Nitrososphaeria archaeon]